MANMVNITIDGKNIQAEEGTNLMQAAKHNGVFIPSLCHYEHMEPPLGTCRVCTCKINGRYAPACTEKVVEGLNVEVNIPELQDTRKALVEMMFAEGNHICPTCEKSGNCDLQHIAYELGISSTRFPHLYKKREVDLKPKHLIMEHNRCIKCMRCVVDVLTNDGKKVFTYLNRGYETIVGIDYEQEAKLNEKDAVRAMNICPTGAILAKEACLPQPFGNRRFDQESVQPTIEEKSIRHKSTSAMDRKVVATASLGGCFGCHMSLLDIDEELLDVVELVDFNKSPVNDIKKFTTRCHVGIIEGGCCNADNVENLRAFREHCDVLVCVGECAIWGGLPSMRNPLPLSECLEEAYLNSPTNERENRTIPYHEDLPKLLDRVYACNEIVKIDYYIPGCPPNPQHMWKAVKNILWEEDYAVLYSEFKYD